jgi:hypothetical protein
MTSAPKQLFAVVCLAALGSLAKAAPLPTLTLDPVNGAITGAAGSTIGWGFTLTNLGSYYAVVTGSDFCVGVVTSPCGNSIGTYTDFAGPQFLLLGPAPESTSFAQVFDNNLQTGMGSFFINLGATGTLLGDIVLSYDLFSIDPNSMNFDPLTDTFSVGNFLTAAASVTVGTLTVATPEPASLLLVLIGIAALAISKGRLKTVSR